MYRIKKYLSISRIESKYARFRAEYWIFLESFAIFPPCIRNPIMMN